MLRTELRQNRMDRSSLVDQLGITLPELASWAVDHKTQVAVDRRLGEILGVTFGTRLRFFETWVMPQQRYSLEQIQKRLTEAGVDVNAADLVQEHLWFRARRDRINDNPHEVIGVTFDSYQLSEGTEYQIVKWKYVSSDYVGD